MARADVGRCQWQIQAMKKEGERLHKIFKFWAEFFYHIEKCIGVESGSCAKGQGVRVYEKKTKFVGKKKEGRAPPAPPLDKSTTECPPLPPPNTHTHTHFFSPFSRFPTLIEDNPPISFLKSAYVYNPE